MSLFRWLGRSVAPIAAIALAASVAACSSPDMNDAGDPSCSSSGDRTAVMTQFVFVTSSMGQTVSDGFDLDNRVSAEGDAMSCGIGDFTSPTGTPGIDNRFSALVDAINMATNNVLATDIHNAINNGQLLVAVSIQHVDDLQNDPCVDVVFRKATGTPLVGTDGLLTANQTFDIDPMAPVSTVHAAIVNGVIDAGPFELALPINVLDANFIIHLHDTRLHMTVASDGSISALVGGGVGVDELIAITNTLTIGSDLRDLAAQLSMANADLAQTNGTCTQISSAFTLTGVPAFVN